MEVGLGIREVGRIFGESLGLNGGEDWGALVGDRQCKAESGWELWHSSVNKGVYPVVRVLQSFYWTWPTWLTVRANR